MKSFFYTLLLIIVVAVTLSFASCGSSPQRNSAVVQQETYDGYPVVYDNSGQRFINIAGDLMLISAYRGLVNHYGRSQIVSHIHDVSIVHYNPSIYRARNVGSAPRMRIDVGRTNSASNNTRSYKSYRAAPSNNPFTRNKSSSNPFSRKRR